MESTFRASCLRSVTITSDSTKSTTIRASARCPAAKPSGAGHAHGDCGADPRNGGQFSSAVLAGEQRQAQVGALPQLLQDALVHGGPAATAVVEQPDPRPRVTPGAQTQ